MDTLRSMNRTQLIQPVIPCLAKDVVNSTGTAEMAQHRQLRFHPELGSRAAQAGCFPRAAQAGQRHDAGRRTCQPTPCARRVQSHHEAPQAGWIADWWHPRDPGDAGFLRQHGILSDIGTIRMDEINTAYERMLKSDVKYRFVVDVASLPFQAA